MIPRLITSAIRLQRKIYASLPWGYRVGQLLTRVSSYTTDAIGKAFYQKFRENGKITGLEDRDDGRAFGKSLFQMALLVTKNQAKAEDVLQGVFQECLEKGIIKRLDGPVARAEGYLRSMVRTRALNFLRPERRHPTDSLVVQNDEGDEVERVLSDPRQWQDLDEGLVEQMDIQRIKHKLHSIDPNMEVYFDLMLDGVTDSQILRDKMLPMMQERGEISPSSWSMTYRPKYINTIKKLLHQTVG